MYISFIIRTLNEHGNISRLIERINEITRKYNITNEIIVIDDNSTDGTIEDIKNLQKHQKNLRLIVRKTALGIGSAHIAGYNLARGDLIISMDADLSHPPEKITDLINKINLGNDMVMGSRYIPGGSTDKNLKFYLISKMGGYYLSFMLRIKILDFTTGYRVIKKEVWQKIKNYRYSKKNVFLIECIYYAHKHGAKLAEIPIFFKEREIGESKTPLFKEAIKALFLPFKMKYLSRAIRT